MRRKPLILSFLVTLAPVAAAGGAAGTAGGGAHASASSSGAGQSRAAPGHSFSGMGAARIGAALKSGTATQVTVEGKRAIAVRLEPHAALSEKEAHKLRDHGFIPVGDKLGPNNSPLFCSHSLYNGMLECVWFPLVPGV
jgi:hypothetical protein